jgi:hypothetical protein
MFLNVKSVGNGYRERPSDSGLGLALPSEADSGRVAGCPPLPELIFLPEEALPA